MLFLVSVSSFNVPTDWASLTGILQAYIDDHAVISRSLILQLLLKVIEAPTDRHIAVFSSDLSCCMSDSGQVFQNKQRVLGVVFDECLRYTMVHILHPTVFSLPERFQSSSRRRRPALLKVSSDLVVLCSLCFAFCSTIYSLFLTLFLSGSPKQRKKQEHRHKKSTSQEMLSHAV